MGEQVKKIDREYILWRISDWKKRLNQLWSDIEGWAGDFGKAEIQKNEIPQAREDLMHRFDIDPETVPAMAIRLGRHRASFVPMGLWVIGSNGRVNVNTNKKQYILLDLGGDDGNPSQWTVVNPSKRKQRISLDRNTLAKLIKDEELFL
jgi:hypothetical protein